MSDPSGAEAASAHPLLRFLRRHAVFLLLLVVLLFHGGSTFGVYLSSDDITWLRRTVSDASRPWNLLVEPLYSNYFRPVIHAIWLANYALWGFNFDGYQLTLVLLWLAGVATLYGLACRWGGRIAGVFAAAVIGLNNVYLLLATWKSWYTVLAEFTLVCVWCWSYSAWVEAPTRRRLWACCALGLLGTLTKESFPLIVSCAVFVTWVVAGAFDGRRTFWKRLALWAAASVAVMLALPSYRALVWDRVFGGATAVVSDAPPEFSLGYVVPRFCTHAADMIGRGVGRPLLTFALIWGAWEVFRVRERRPQTYRNGLLGALAIGGIVMGVSWVASSASPGSVLGPVWAAMAFAAFVALALAGDRWDRMLAVWFVASLAPILPFRLGSGAYHVLALAALTLYVGRRAARFWSEEGAASLARARSAVPRDGRETPRTLLLLLFAAAMLHQAGMLAGNVRFVHSPVPPGPRIETLPMRVARGRAARERVDRAVAALRASPDAARVVWLDGDGLEWVAALELQQMDGWTVKSLADPHGLRIGLRRFDSPLGVYSHAIVYDADLFGKLNLFPNAGFEDDVPGMMRSERGRSGRHALITRTTGPGPENLSVVTPSFRLGRNEPVVFGGFVRREAAAPGQVVMVLESAGDRAYGVPTRALRQTKPEWELLWGCAALPDSVPRFSLKLIEARGVQRGTIEVDDVFVCPVEALIRSEGAAAR